MWLSRSGQAPGTHWPPASCHAGWHTWPLGLPTGNCRDWLQGTRASLGSRGLAVARQPGRQAGGERGSEEAEFCHPPGKLSRLRPLWVGFAAHARRDTCWILAGRHGPQRKGRWSLLVPPRQALAGWLPQFKMPEKQKPPEDQVVGEPPSRAGALAQPSCLGHPRGQRILS